jgi:hypothetical protein
MICFFSCGERYDIPFAAVVNIMQRLKPPKKNRNSVEWTVPIRKNFLKDYLVKKPADAFW